MKRITPKAPKVEHLGLLKDFDGKAREILEEHWPFAGSPDPTDSVECIGCEITFLAIDLAVSRFDEKIYIECPECGSSLNLRIVEA